MSQLPIKKEVSVKKELTDGNLTRPASTSNGSTNSSTEGWQDIPLKCCTKEEVKDIRYHIMKFQSKQNVDIVENFTKPVRLHRKDPRNIQFHLTREELDKRKREEEEAKVEKEKVKQEDIEAAEQEAIANGEDPKKIDRFEADMSQVAPDGGARKAKKSLFKRKTRQINLMNEEKRKLRYEEYYPWVMEDYDGKNVFVGNYEAGSSDTQHVLFVFDKDGFKMVPAEKVYKFTQRNKYATLTLEEAEAKMEKNSSVPRWLMRHMEDNSSLEGATADQRFRHSAGPSSSVNAGAAAASNNRRRLRTVLSVSTANERDSDHDDLDFDEEFADDEEAPIMDGDEEENKLSEQKIKKEMLKAAHFDGQSDAEVDDDDIDDLFETEKSRKVDKEGKKLRKVLNKTEGGVYDSDDDDDKLNPYLSKSDLESDDDSDDDIAIKKEDDDSLPDNTGSPKPSHRAFTSHDLGDGFVLIKAPSPFLSGFPPGDWTPNGRKRPAASNTVPNKKPKVDDGKSSNLKLSIKNENGNRSVSPSLPGSPMSPSLNVDLSSSGPDNVLVTVQEVLDIVKDNPLTTKELLFGLKNRVNAHKDNKLRIISIVKQNLKLVDGKLVLKEE